MNPVALYDTLNCLHQSAVDAQAGDQDGAKAAQEAARSAASAAFPAGTPEAKALGMFLAMDPVPLRDFLNCLSLAVLHREAGENLAAEITQLGASAAALAVFRVGSREGWAAGVLLIAAKRVSEAVS